MKRFVVVFIPSSEADSNSTHTYRVCDTIGVTNFWDFPQIVAYFDSESDADAHCIELIESGI